MHPPIPVFVAGTKPEMPYLAERMMTKKETKKSFLPPPSNLLKLQFFFSFPHFIDIYQVSLKSTFLTNLYTYSPSAIMFKNQIYTTYINAQPKKNLSSYLLSRHVQAREPKKYFCVNKTVSWVYSDMLPFHIQKVQHLDQKNQVVEKLQIPSSWWKFLPEYALDHMAKIPQNLLTHCLAFWW